jgi:hypothetical protein
VNILITADVVVDDASPAPSDILYLVCERLTSKPWWYKDHQIKGIVGFHLENVEVRDNTINRIAAHGHKH